MHAGDIGIGPMIRPIHLRMARAALNWTLRDLETKAGVNKNTLSRYEAGREVLSGTLESIEKVFDDEGVIFIVEEGSLGPGVRLTRKAHVRVIKRGRRRLTGRKVRAKPKSAAKRAG